MKIILNRSALFFYHKLNYLSIFVLLKIKKYKPFIFIKVSTIQKAVHQKCIRLWQNTKK